MKHKAFKKIAIAEKVMATLRNRNGDKGPKKGVNLLSLVEKLSHKKENELGKESADGSSKDSSLESK